METDHDRPIAALLTEIEQRGLGDAYARALARIVGVPIGGAVGHYPDYAWRLLSATPEQHRRAFAAACGESQ